MAGFSLPDADVDVSTDTVAEINAIFEDMYKVLVHNDDVTTFDTVITALVQLFDHTVEEAKKLADQVHTQGKAVAAVLPKAEAEAGMTGLHGFKIQSTIQKA